MRFLLLVMLFLLQGCGKASKQCSSTSCALNFAETVDGALAKAISKYGVDEESSLETDIRCRVFAQIHDFDIVPLFSLFNEMERETVFAVMVDEFKKIGEVNVTEAKPLFESLFADPPKDVNAILSIGMICDFKLSSFFRPL